MNYDYGSRDPRFIKVVADIRSDVLRICEVEKGEYECVLVQGSGSYGVEAALGTAIPRTGAKLLVIANGAYGLRQVKMAAIYNIPTVVLEYSDNEVVIPADVEKKLIENPDITHVSIIHSETTSGSLLIHIHTRTLTSYLSKRPYQSHRGSRESHQAVQPEGKRARFA